METFTLRPSERRRRLVALMAALVALAASLAIAHFGPSTARANGTPPLFTITTETSPDAPGMVKVSWTEPAGVDSAASNERWFYRLSWVTTSASPPIASVVLDQQSQQRTATTSVVVPNLLPGSNYSITVDVVTVSAVTDSYHQVAGVSPVTVNNVTVTAAPLSPCTSGTVCGSWATTSAQSGPVLVRAQVFSNATSGDINQVERGLSWDPTSEWPGHNSRQGNDWIPVTMHFIDFSGQLAAHWWSPFPSDSGRSFEASTPVLVPKNGPSVNVGTVTLSAGTPVSGTLRRQVGGTDNNPATLSLGTPGSSYVDVDGDFVDDRDGDFVDLCIEVLRDTSVGGDNSIEFATVMCAYRGAGFPDPATRNPRTNPGEWRMALPPGEYFLRFVDRANYFGDANALLYNVRFASQFWRPDGARGERLFLPPSDPVAPGRLVVDTTPRTGIDGILRVAQQLRVDVVDIPFTDAMALSSNLRNLRGGVYLQDTVSGAWTGGRMTLVTTSAISDPARVGGATLSASVTGLVAGRAYRVFLDVENDWQGDGQLRESWLVGGGTLENASGIVPGPVIREPWPVRPILVTLHRADGTPYGDDEACLAVFPSGTNATGTPSASECTATFAVPGFGINLPGLVFLQRLPIGNYEVYAYKKSGTSVVGRPIQIATSFAVTRNLQPVPGFSLVKGLADISRLASGATLGGTSLSSWYFGDNAVVVP